MVLGLIPDGISTDPFHVMARLVRVSARGTVLTAEARTSRAMTIGRDEFGSIAGWYDMSRQGRRAERGQAANRDDPAANNAIGIALGMQGRPDQAVACFRRAIALRPDFPDAHYNLGNALAALGRPDEAASSLRRSIELRPDFLQAHYNLGIILGGPGQFDRAAACFRRAIEIQPDFADAHGNLGTALKNLGQFDQAIASFRTALDLRPDFAEAHHNLGVALAEQGRLDEAAASFRSAIGLRPDIPEAHNGLGNTLAALGRPDEAAACFRTALELRPQYAEACYNLGNALARLERFDQAIASFRTAIGLKPNYGEAHNNLGNALAETGLLEEAIASYRTAIAIDPNNAQAHSNLGKALWQNGSLDEALACCRRAVGLQPDYPEGHINLGIALGDQGRLDDAIECYRTAIALRPDTPDAHHNLGIALLKRGEMEAGWQEYEWRWKTRQLIGQDRGFNQPLWRGEAAARKTLLIHAEQGFGDTLQFCRYAPMAAARGLRVILEVPAALVRLLRSLPGIDRVCARGEALPAFDLHCPMLSLPLAFGTTLASVPGETPYLHADAAQADEWRMRCDRMAGESARVGLVWAGNPRLHLPALTDSRRSVAPARLAPLFDVPGPRFFSLQKDGPGTPAEFPLIDVMDMIEDFAGTAALIANLDLVISVDTAGAHLAAALGKPVWLLDRFDLCWRWLIGRRDSPWYPTLRIYRQPASGDWDSVMTEVARDLACAAREWPALLRSAG